MRATGDEQSDPCAAAQDRGPVEGKRARSGGDGFVVVRRLGDAAPFTPYRIGDIPELMREIAEKGRRIHDPRPQKALR